MPRRSRAPGEGELTLTLTLTLNPGFGRLLRRQGSEPQVRHVDDVLLAPPLLFAECLAPGDAAEPTAEARARRCRQAALGLGAVDRGGFNQWVSELIATMGLLLTILGCLKTNPKAVPAAVGLYISAAYWFTASTSFANPAVTIARGFTNTFSGIDLSHVPMFILSQFAGATVALLLIQFLFSRE